MVEDYSAQVCEELAGRFEAAGLHREDFVETVLNAAQENLDRKSRIRALGYDFDWLLDRVLGIFGLTFKELLTGGKQRRTVQALGCPQETDLEC